MMKKKKPNLMPAGSKPSMVVANAKPLIANASKGLSESRPSSQQMAPLQGQGPVGALVNNKQGSQG